MTGIYPDRYITYFTGEQKCVKTIDQLARCIARQAQAIGMDTSEDALAEARLHCRQLNRGAESPLDRHDLGDLMILLREWLN